MYDITIVGAGPAGLTAAIYALRADKKVLLLEKETFGGQITYSPRVENYPSQLAISGNELAEMMLSQVMEHGAEIELAEEASRRLGLDFAGIDILFGKDGPLLCEVNSNAHFKSTYDCTGVDLASLIAEHIISKLR